MKAIITYIVVSLIAMICCAENQTVVKGKFVGYDYDFTKNKTFINITYLFSTDSGTVRINKKQFYADVKKKTFIDYGLAIIQRFRVDTTYTIVLQQIRAADFIPKNIQLHITKRIAKWIQVTLSLSIEMMFLLKNILGKTIFNGLMLILTNRYIKS